MTGKVILDKRSVNGHAYVELLDDGRVKAGYYPDTAKVYNSVEDAYARFRQSYELSSNHSAWNICYVLEDYLPENPAS